MHPQDLDALDAVISAGEAIGSSDECEDEDIVSAASEDEDEGKNLVAIKKKENSKLENYATRELYIITCHRFCPTPSTSHSLSACSALCYYCN